MTPPTICLRNIPIGYRSAKYGTAYIRRFLYSHSSHGSSWYKRRFTSPQIQFPSLVLGFSANKSSGTTNSTTAEARVEYKLLLLLSANLVHERAIENTSLLPSRKSSIVPVLVFPRTTTAKRCQPCEKNCIKVSISFTRHALRLPLRPASLSFSDSRLSCSKKSTHSGFFSSISLEKNHRIGIVAVSISSFPPLSNNFTAGSCATFNISLFLLKCEWF